MNQSIINLEHEIAAFINKDNGATVHFRYEDLNNLYKVSAYTVNNISKEMFLLKSAETFSPIDSLSNILTYVKELKGLNSFTVSWKKVGDSSPIQTSYFYCHDITDVITKFFSDKTIADYIIHEIKLNPIS